MDRLDEHKRQPLALAQHQQCRSAHSLCSYRRGRGAHACHHDWQDGLRNGVQHSAAVYRGVHVEEDGIGLFSAYASYKIAQTVRQASVPRRAHLPAFMPVSRSLRQAEYLPRCLFTGTFCYGRVAEWFKVELLKLGRARSAGSNPALTGFKEFSSVREQRIPNPRAVV